jgi:amino acid transporter
MKRIFYAVIGGVLGFIASIGLNILTRIDVLGSSGFNSIQLFIQKFLPILSILLIVIGMIISWVSTKPPRT